MSNLAKSIGQRMQAMSAEQRLNEFTRTELNRLAIEQGDVFGAAMSQVCRYRDFLTFILKRYVDEDKRFYDNTQNMEALCQRLANGGHTAPGEYDALYADGQQLYTSLHLDIESFYLFAKILLDRFAYLITFYFGEVRAASLAGHHKLTKNLVEYARQAGLQLPHGIVDVALELQTLISDFRDDHITHKPHHRMRHGTSFGADCGAVIVKSGTDRQAETRPLDDLLLKIDRYIGMVLDFMETNRSEARLKLAPPNNG